MLTGKISFASLPEIGFAMRYSRRRYSAVYGSNFKQKIEIAYINSGSIDIMMNGEKFHAPEGSVVVLFRHLPISTETVGDNIHSHDTVLGEFTDLDFELGGNDTVYDVGRLEIPFVTMPSANTEKVGVKLRRIVSDMADDRENKNFCAAVTFVSILKELADIYEAERIYPAKATAKNVSKIKEYIENNIDSSITIADISAHINRSPNHTGRIFKNSMGMTVAEYVNLRKMKKVSELIKKNISFADACNSVSLCDSSYGYCLFKKYIGLTPGEFLRVNSVKG